jgi:hypothetical protein
MTTLGTGIAMSSEAWLEANTASTMKKALGMMTVETTITIDQAR